MAKTAKSVAGVPPKAGGLLEDVRALIRAARGRTARAVNAELVALHRGVGDRTRREVLKGKGAEYGKKIVPALSGQLTAEFGNGFGRRNLFNVIRRAEGVSRPDDRARTECTIGRDALPADHLP